ncbi:MAG: hypothetical protein K1X89_20510 [Myxococcaceae bacterium]|nr:hypothetical protein [Myxococcaceae bacterium]
MAGNRINSQKTVVTMKVFSRESKGGTVRRDSKVEVTKPKDARGLTRAFTKVIGGFETQAKEVAALVQDKRISDRFSEGKIAAQMTKAAQGKTRTIDIIDNRGRTVDTVKVDPKSLGKTYAEVVNRMESRLGFEVVDQSLLGRRLATLAKGIDSLAKGVAGGAVAGGVASASSKKGAGGAGSASSKKKAAAGVGSQAS